MQSDHLSGSCNGNPDIVTSFSAQFQSDSMKIDLIANPGMGDDLGHSFAYCTDRSYCDKIRIQILS